jgi:3-dehydroquinate dehydratase-2
LYEKTQVNLGFSSMITANNDKFARGPILASILVLHGPNLNLLGTREPDKYGHTTLADINQQLQEQASKAGHHLQHLQSNAEYELVECIHDAHTEGVDFIIINPAAFTHTSVALRDALLAVNIPFIEVHLSNVHARETFRHHSFFSDIAKGVICGLGAIGYALALTSALEQLDD